MEALLSNPAFILAVIALITALGNWINGHTQQNKINSLTATTAKHETQLNGGFDNRVQAVVKPMVDGTAQRLEATIDRRTIPKVE